MVCSAFKNLVMLDQIVAAGRKGYLLSIDLHPLHCLICYTYRHSDSFRNTTRNEANTDGCDADNGEHG